MSASSPMASAVEPSASAPVVVLTGAGSGIGAATARLLAPSGARLVLHTRGAETVRRERLEAVGRACEAVGAKVALVTGDLAEPGVGTRVVETALTTFGGLDHLVANAGYADRRGTMEVGRSDLQRSWATMVAAFLEMAQTARPALVASPRGRVVLVSSFVAHRFAKGGLFPVSAAAKAGAEALARSLAAELAPNGVTVNAVVPGYTRKDSGTTALTAGAWEVAEEMTPLGRLGEAADVAAAIAFLLSDGARHITGQALAVDGGLSLL
jgi:3-oxoacyl-[acyl-carrier protein] reductase